MIIEKVEVFFHLNRGLIVKKNNLQLNNKILKLLTLSQIE